MSLHIIFLILLAALFHSIWNIVLKDSENSNTVAWIQMIITCIALIPFILINGRLPSVNTIPTLIFSGIMQAVYYMLLTKCYRVGNISIVYPIIRGSGPVFVCLISLLFGLESITPSAAFSIMLIILGIYLVNMPSLRISDILLPFKTLITDKATRISLAVGLSIALYTISDKQNVKYTDPLMVYFITALIPALILAPAFAKKDHIYAAIIETGIPKILIISICTFLAYFLVLNAMSTTNASYVSSVREVSVVFVVLYGSIRNRDKAWKPKMLGAITIFTGILLVAISSN